MPEKTVNADIRGTFYRRPDPDSSAFVNPGDAVEEGDVIGLIEVMKNFMEVKSDQSGNVKEFLVEDGELIKEESPILTLE